ncbi:MAG: MptD family putative ECF transporter S component [Desulfovibrio sp.]|jgi:energy-coupling factor transport system substrate-specific component|nr:MptD family putative ECF transporter S component [Desulfovibrio sp.]
MDAAQSGAYDAAHRARRGDQARRGAVAEAAPAPHGAYWSTRELVTIGVFATVIKASTIMVAYMGGGMNPVTLAAKNCLYVTLMIVLLHKVPRSWTMPLAVGITAMVSLLIMGSGVLYVPASIAACLLGEGAIRALGGYGRTRNVVLGVLVAEIASKAAGFGLSCLIMREQPGMLATSALFIGIGSTGTFLGAFTGVRFMEELRHAGIISH